MAARRPPAPVTAGALLEALADAVHFDSARVYVAERVDRGPLAPVLARPGAWLELDYILHEADALDRPVLPSVVRLAAAGDTAGARRLVRAALHGERPRLRAALLPVLAAALEAVGSPVVGYRPPARDTVRAARARAIAARYFWLDSLPTGDLQPHTCAVFNGVRALRAAPAERSLALEAFLLETMMGEARATPRSPVIAALYRLTGEAARTTRWGEAGGPTTNALRLAVWDGAVRDTALDAALRRAYAGRAGALTFVIAWAPIPGPSPAPAAPR